MCHLRARGYTPLPSSLVVKTRPWARCTTCTVARRWSWWRANVSSIGGCRCVAVCASGAVGCNRVRTTLEFPGWGKGAGGLSFPERRSGAGLTSQRSRTSLPCTVCLSLFGKGWLAVCCFTGHGQACARPPVHVAAVRYAHAAQLSTPPGNVSRPCAPAPSGGSWRTPRRRRRSRCMWQPLRAWGGPGCRRIHK